MVGFTSVPNALPISITVLHVSRWPKAQHAWPWGLVSDGRINRTAKPPCATALLVAIPVQAADDRSDAHGTYVKHDGRV